MPEAIGTIRKGGGGGGGRKRIQRIKKDGRVGEDDLDAIE